MYWEVLSILVWTEDGSCWTRLLVRLAMCPAIKAPEDARAEEDPEATVGKIWWSWKGHERRNEEGPGTKGLMRENADGRATDNSADIDRQKTDYWLAPDGQ